MATHNRDDGIRDLLQLVTDAGKADAFTLVGLVVRHAQRLLVPLELAMNAGLVERVSPRVGVWYYRLTDAGEQAARTGRIPKPPVVESKRIRQPRPGSRI